MSGSGFGTRAIERLRLRRLSSNAWPWPRRLSQSRPRPYVSPPVAVREALDDVVDEQSEPNRGTASGGAAGVEILNAREGQDGADVGGARDDAGGSLVGTATSVDVAERSYAGAGTPSDDVREQPGSQVAS